VTKGLVDREAKLQKTTEDLWQQAVAANQELTCFRALAANEVLRSLGCAGDQQARFTIWINTRYSICRCQLPTPLLPKECHV
jgi:hypothetical protein